MKKASIFFFFLCCVFIDVQGQLVADFEADTLSFCPPRTVRFRDLSTGGNIISRNWRFSATQSSNTNNPFPIATFTTPGTHNISLTISDGNNTATVTKSAYIKVFQPPRAEFSIPGPRQACAPLNFQINNASTPGDAPINWQRFSFGDGSLSYQQSPAQSYTAGGLYTVSLQISDTNGCQGTKTRQQYIQVYPKPNANFSTKNSPHDCQPPHLVEFVDRSSGKAPFQYFWTFGDGNVSTQSNPKNTYSSGVFDVSLRIRDANGCRDTLTRPAFASVTTTNASFQIPDTICKGDTVSILNTSVGGNTYTWDFGDGTNSSDRNVKKLYSAKGHYRIKLSISAGANCFDSTSKVIYVDELVANFSQSHIFSCDPKNVTYVDQSAGNRINSWLWHFSNGDTSILQNPASLYRDPGTYDARLIVENLHGCRDTMIKSSHFRIAVINPVIDNDVDSGCGPLTVVFRDRSSPADSVVRRMWDWGDGTAQDTSVNPSHTFQQPGLYIVRLTVRSPSGCDYSTTKRILVGSKQTANFVINKDSICAGDGFDITNTSTDSLLITNYHWQFSDGGEFMAKDPDPYQPVDTGMFDVTLIVEHNGCYDTLVQNDVVYVKGPVGQMNVGILCDKPYEANVAGLNWKEVQRFKWTMGDFIGKDSTNQQFQYTYQNRGRYKVVMSLYNDSNGCRYIRDTYAEIYDLIVNLNLSDTIFCTPAQLTLDAIGSQDASLLKYSNLASQKDTITNQWSVPMRSNTKGYHMFRLIGTAPNGCSDTAYQRVKGFKPEADFIVSDTLGCFPLTSTFRDRSLSDTTIRFFKWYLGAGIQGSDSVETVTYPLKGNFGVELQIEDVLGCRDTITRKQLIDIRQPEIYFDPDSMLCAGDSVSVDNLNHKPDYSYVWSANSNYSYDSVATFGFSSGGLYDIVSIVEDSMGCTDTLVRKVNFQDIPIARLRANPKDTNCYPALVTFEDITNHPNIEWRTWTFGLGDPPITRRNKKMSYTYPFPGKYDVSLIVETTFGCRDTLIASEYVEIGGPYADFELDNDTACVGETVNFELDSIINTFSVDWDFGDGFGAQLPGNEKQSSHVFQTPGKYSVRVLLNDTAFECLSSVEDTIEVFEVIADLATTDSAGCAPHELSFSDKSQFSDQRRWLNSSGTISTDSTDSFKYTEPGQFPLYLVAINSQNGCTDTAFKLVRVWPVPQIDLTDDTVLCEGEQLILEASGADQYEWSPAIGVSSTTDSVVIAQPKDAITYYVYATNSYNCSTEDSMNIKVQKPFSFSSGDDTTIFVGEEVSLMLRAADTSLLYRWNPVNDLSCNLCPEPIASPPQTTVYTASITDPFGCFMSSAVIKVNVEEEFEVHIPNAFTPNGDQVNDLFYAVTYGIKQLNYLRVYDRWGKVLFEGTEFKHRWDGKVANSDCPIGTYVWGFEGLRFNDQTVNLVGTVNIIR